MASYTGLEECTNTTIKRKMQKLLVDKTLLFMIGIKTEICLSHKISVAPKITIIAGIAKFIHRGGSHAKQLSRGDDSKYSYYE